LARVRFDAQATAKQVQVGQTGPLCPQPGTESPVIAAFWGDVGHRTSARGTSMSEGSIARIRKTALKLLGSRVEETVRVEKEPTFGHRPSILSAEETAAYRALVAAGENRLAVFPKMHLVDFLYVHDGVQRIEDAVRMDRKRVDFLLCDAETMRPLAVVDLFSLEAKGSHRQNEDPFVVRALADCGLSCFRIEARTSYPIDDLRNRLVRRLFAKKA
jgi:hypothetical protein